MTAVLTSSPVGVRAPRQARSRIEETFVVVAYLIMAGAVIPVLRQRAGGAADSFTGDAFMGTLYTFVKVVAVGLLLLRRRRLRLASRSDLLLLLLGLFVLASAAWSLAPALTLRRWSGFAGSCLLGVYLGRRFGYANQLKLLARACAIMVIGSLIFVLVVPEIGIDQDIHVGAWKGIFIQKNTLGQMMVLSIMSFSLMLRNGARPLVWRSLIVIAVLLVIMSSSVTSQGIALAAFAFVSGFHRVQRSRRGRAPTVVLGIVAASALVIFMMGSGVENLDAVGRDATLTGRTEVWAEVVTQIHHRPVLGVGYEAFWTGDPAASGPIWRDLGFKVSHSHNGLLEICLEIGLLGGAVFLLWLISWLVRSWRLLVRQATPDALIPICIATLVVLQNVTEVNVLRQNALLWVLAVSFSVGIGQLPRSLGVRAS